MKKLTLLILLISLILLNKIPIYGQTGGLNIVSGVIDFSGAATSTKLFKAVTNLPGTCDTQSLWWRTSDNTVWYCSATNVFTQFASAASTIVTHSFVCNIGNATGTTVITTGDTGCYSNTGSFSGTINRLDIIGNAASLATCSITVDIWKANAAFPTSGNKISASAPATLTTAKVSQSGSISGWTTAVAANDIWGASVATVTGCVYAQVRVEFK